MSNKGDTTTRVIKSIKNILTGTIIDPHELEELQNQVNTNAGNIANNSQQISNILTQLGFKVTAEQVLQMIAEAGVGTGVSLGETSNTAYRGDKGKTAYDHSQLSGNPHNTTKANINLGNVDNTSDLNKPISNAQAAVNAAKADLVDEKIPLAQMPLLDFYQYFNPAYYVLGPAGIEPANGNSGELPTTLPPTNAVVNDSANTFGFTNAGGLTTLDTEKTFNAGTSAVVNTDNPFDVGDYNFAINTVGVRYKATSERQASPWLYNSIPFTSAGGGGAEDGFVNVTDFVLSDVVMSGNDQTFTGESIGQSYSVQGFPIGAAFEVRFDASITSNGGNLGVSDGNGNDGYGSSIIFAAWARQSNSNGRFQGQINRGTGVYPSYLDFTVTPCFRIYSALNETVIHSEFSFDGKTNWIDFTSGTPIPRPASVLRIKTFFDQANTNIKNMRAKGLTNV